MKKSVLLIICVLIGLLGDTVMGNDILNKLKSIVQTLPDEIQGWKKPDEGVVYSQENLYEYINGGAELYISYQFKHLLSQTYVDKDSIEIRIDLFDMGSSYNAYGIFGHGKEQLDHFVSPDVESEYASGLLTFWKGRYYVSILAYPETEKKKLIVKTLASMIADQINEKSEKPPIVSKLPAEGLDLSSIRYIRHFTWLNSYMFILDKNYLNFDSNTHAVMAKYNFTEIEKKPSVLIMIQYQNSNEANAAYQSFLKHVMPEAQSGFKELKDSKWAGCKQDDNIIIIVWNAPDKETAEVVLNGMKK
jgi:hypothetical protein